MRLWLALALPAALFAGPTNARENIGVYGVWGAFLDRGPSRCFAVAKALESPFAREFKPYVTIGLWPKSKVRNQFHARLSRKVGDGSRVTLVAGGQSFALVAKDARVWSNGQTADNAIVAAIRATQQLRIHGRDQKGRRFTDRYDLDGAATAIDAATLRCASLI